MESKVYLSIYVLLIAIKGNLACDPAEEGKPYDLKFTTAKLPKESTMVMWTKDDILVAECPVDTGDCITNDMHWLSAKVEKQNELVTFNMHIYNVSRYISHSAKGLWKLRTHASSPSVEVFYHCNLQVYAKPQDMSCNIVWSSFGLNVTCRVTRTYPEALMLVEQTSRQVGPISCVNDKLSDEPVYYKATCNVQFPQHQLSLKADVFNIFIYPNTIAKTVNTHIGVNTSATLYTEPAYVVLKECEIRKNTINCSCKSLDRTMSHIDWYNHGVKIDNKHNFYVINLSNATDTEHEIVCKTAISSDSEKICSATTDPSNSAAIVLAILLVISILVILLLLTIYIKRLKPVRDMLQRIWRTYSACARRNTSGDTSPKEDVTTSLILAEGNTQQNTCNSANIDPTIPGTSEVQALQSENAADINLYKISSSVLLLGTVNSNKELLKRSILQREFRIKKTDDKKSIVDTKDKNVIFEVSKKFLGSLPQFSMPDEKKIQLHYTKRNDEVIKLVDGPVYDTNNINKFIEDMKSCISLSQERFNAIIVAFTLDRAKDCNSLINMLHGNFGINVNNLILVIIYENELKIEKAVEGDFYQVKNVCGDRLLRYNIENHIQEIKHLISCVSQMEFNCNSQPLCIKNERSLQYSEWEEILKDICLMLEMILDDSQTLHDETKEGVDLLVMLWRKHKDFTKQEIDTDDDDQTKKDEFNSNNKHTIKMDNSIIEDVTHVIECFRIIYSVSEPMRRCKEILIPSFKTSYQNFHDWFVMSVIKDKENLLDSNLKMKLFNLMKKRSMEIK